MVFAANIPMANCIQTGLITMNGAPTGTVTGIFEHVMVGGINPLSAPDMANVETNTVLEKNTQFNVFPNPASNQISLDLESLIGERAQISVYNHLGQLVLQEARQLIQDNIKRMNIAHLTAGTYVIEIQTDSERMSKKLVKTDW